MPKPKPTLLASAGDEDSIRELVRKYWYLKADFDPLITTDDPNVYGVRNGRHPDGDPSVRVIRKGGRFRFESLPCEAA